MTGTDQEATFARATKDVRLSPAYSVEKLEILRPPLFSRKSLVPKMALTFLV
jgi:hypothetical protein